MVGLKFEKYLITFSSFCICSLNPNDTQERFTFIWTDSMASPFDRSIFALTVDISVKSEVEVFSSIHKCLLKV